MSSIHCLNLLLLYGREILNLVPLRLRRERIEWNQSTNLPISCAEELPRGKHWVLQVLVQWVVLIYYELLCHAAT